MNIEYNQPIKESSLNLNFRFKFLKIFLLQNGVWTS